VGEVTRIERVGGHPAVDFVNTLGGLPTAPNDEYLFAYADLLTWAHGARLVGRQVSRDLRLAAERGPRQAGAVFRQARDLRAHLDAALRARLAGRIVGEEHRTALRDAYVAALARADLRLRSGRYTWTWPNPSSGQDLEYPLWTIADQAVELLRFGPLDRLNQCGHCRWLFLDTSKNHSRRWCSMQACGAVMKMRRYRAAARGPGARHRR
jgi:predicted RNA-binding Zn ribbon-like protein